MSALSLNVFGIEITWNNEDRGGAAITSNMHETYAPENHAFNAGVDAIESMVLAHFCAGVDVASPAYLEGVETAYQALGNNLDAPDEPELLASIDGRFYQWLKPTETEDGLRYLHIEDEVNLSDLMFSSIEEAVKAITEEIWGWDAEDAEDFALVQVEKRLLRNPFASS